MKPRGLERFFLVSGATCVVAIVVAALVWPETGSYVGSDSKAEASIVAPAPTEVMLRYRTALRSIALELEPILKRELGRTDSTMLGSLHDRLVALMVPGQALDYHLALVTKLALLQQYLTQASPSSNQALSTNVASLQQELARALSRIP